MRTYSYAIYNQSGVRTVVIGHNKEEVKFSNSNAILVERIYKTGNRAVAPW